jgi:hypothetical protein
MHLVRPFLLALAGLSLQAQTGEEILARVDRLRHPWPLFSVELTLKDGQGEQRWKVSARENGDARLDGLSPKERGRSVLMLGEQMWLLLPGVKRPVRVSPQQRLLGPAAGGDVARTRFRDDYLVRSMTQESLDGLACWRLDLSARNPGTSARQVLLWVAKEGLLPQKAEFRLASGKLARTARFSAPTEAKGRPVLSGMNLLEANGMEVVLRFTGWTRDGVDPAVFELPQAQR